MKTLKATAPGVLLAAALIVLTGCVSTFKEIKPLASGPPPKERPSVLMVGELQISDSRIAESEQKALGNAFQLGVEKWCTEHKAIAIRNGTGGGNLPANSIVLNGKITEIEKGSAAARFWVGMGAGQQRAQGEFVVHDADGTRLTSFTARKSYLGGLGIGGGDMMKMEDLLDQLGQLVAETTDKWLRGEKID
jgi:hypothetical protein